MDSKLLIRYHRTSMVSSKSQQRRAFRSSHCEGDKICSKRLRYATRRAMRIQICTPQNPRPPHTPKHPLAGAQLRLETSKSHCQAALGPLSVFTKPPCCGVAAPAWLIRSQTKTSESSAPLASNPRWFGLHSMQLTAPPWPLSSSKACPGCRTSRTRMAFES